MNDQQCDALRPQPPRLIERLGVENPVVVFGDLLIEFEGAPRDEDESNEEYTVNYRQRWWFGPWGGLMFLWIWPVGGIVIIVLFFGAKMLGLVS